MNVQCMLKEETISLLRLTLVPDNGLIIFSFSDRSYYSTDLNKLSLCNLILTLD